MKRFGKIATLGSLVLALSGCSEDARQRSIQRNITEVNKVFDNGITKDLMLYLSCDGIDVGPEIHFVDIEGDGKTVEQYVFRYDKKTGFPSPFGYQKNLVRPGAKPKYDPSNIHKIQRTMTPQEEVQIDSSYQALLKMYQR